MVKGISWKEFKKVTKKREVDWYFKPSRPIVFLLVNIAMFLGLSANALSWISVLCIFIGCILVSISANSFLVILGFLFYLLRYFLDASDGSVARLTKVFSSKGLLIDYFGHAFEHILLFFGLTLLSFRLSQNIYVLLLGFGSVVFLSCKKIMEGLIHSGFVYDVFINKDKKSFSNRLNKLKLDVGNQNVEKVGNYRESIFIQLTWDYFTIVLLFTFAYVFYLFFSYWWIFPIILLGYFFVYFVFLLLYMVFMYKNFEKKWLYYIKKIKEILNEKENSKR